MVARVNNSVVLTNSNVHLVQLHANAATKAAALEKKLNTENHSARRLTPSLAIKKTPTPSNAPVKKTLINFFKTKVDIEHELTKIRIEQARAGATNLQQTVTAKQSVIVNMENTTFVNSITQVAAQRSLAPIPVGKPGPENELEEAAKNASRMTPRLSMNGPRRS